LAVLIALGTWQVHRLQWKTDLIATIEARRDAPPATLPQDFDADALADLDFLRVSITGQFQHDGEMLLLARPRKGRPGTRIVTPFTVDGGPVILVDRGWVPVAAEDASRRAEGQIAGATTVEGFLRVPSGGNAFMPANEPERNAWYIMDPDAMAAHAGVPPQPVYVEAGEAENPGGLPIGGRPVATIANNHLQYAVTWYGFAVVLLVVYVFFRRGERERLSRTDS
jgi:surfeit locus 1 family protein